MDKKYSFKTEQQAKDMITSFDADGKLLADISNEITAVVFLGFQHEYEFNAETLKKEGLTFDVDVFWKTAPPESWKEFEVHPKNPKHSWL